MTRCKRSVWPGDLPGEEWKPVPLWPPYEASNLGRIRLVLRRNGKPRRVPRLLNGSLDRGYTRVLLCWSGTKARVPLHTIILETFIGPRPIGMVACHNNGNPSDNTLENLRWDTQSGNCADKVVHGTHRVGASAYWARLTEQQVKEIIALKWIVPSHDLARWFGVTRGCISSIHCGKSWTHLPRQEEPCQRPNTRALFEGSRASALTAP